MTDIDPKNVYAATLRGTPATPSPTGDKFAQDKFLLNQKVLSLGGKYTVFDANQQPLFYVDRPVLKIKSQIGIYDDEAKTRKVLDLVQDSALTIINFAFTLTDASGQVVGTYKRQGWTSMIRRTWHVFDASGKQIAIAQEDSLWKALMRRIPYLDIVGDLLRTNFIVTAPDGRKLGDFIRRYTLTDKYTMDFTPDAQRTVDRRIVLGLAILLDNAEAR